MTIGTHELAPLEPLFSELEEARAHTDQYGSYRGNSDSLEGRQNGLNYDLAKAAEKKVVDKVIDGINEADESVLDGFQKAITVKVIAHTWRTPVGESLGLIADGFKVLDRVKEGAERNRGIIAILGDKTVALYNSNGEDDLQLQPITYERGHHSIVYNLTDGYQVAIKGVDETSFPDLAVSRTNFSKVGLMGGHGNNVGEQLRVLDPYSNKCGLPFIRLGSAERPNGSLDNYINTDEGRFAARILIKTMASAEWIEVSPPGEKLREKVVNEFSDVYKDLLVGDTPRDAVRHLEVEHSRMLGRTDVHTSTTRNTSLASYNFSARSRLFYAADITSGEVEAATREKVAKLEESTTPDGVIKALRAKHYIDAFFRKLTEA